MERSNEIPPPQRVTLPSGAQAVINGALVTAIEDCCLDVGSGAYVLTGSSLRRGRGSMRNPREELYFSVLEAGSSAERFEESRFRLFGLLAEVVAQDRTHQAQRECALCAAALMSGDSAEAIRSAARMAAEHYEGPRGGVAPERRRSPQRSTIEAPNLRTEP